MSVSISWKPKTNDWHTVAGGSDLKEIIEKVFGANGCKQLTSDCIQTLEGIAACGHEGASQLISAIREHSVIVLEFKY